MTFGDVLKSLRQSEDLSISALERLTQINRVTLSRLEGGKTQPSLNMARRLAEALSVSLSVFDVVEIISEKSSKSV